MAADKYEFMTREQLKAECRKLRKVLEGICNEYENCPSGELSIIDECRTALESEDERRRRVHAGLLGVKVKLENKTRGRRKK